MVNEYGKGQWGVLWKRLEQEGNVGLDYVINPCLFPEAVRVLAQMPKALVVDFGCGTNLMGIQLLYGYAGSIAALKAATQLDHARFNVMLYLGIEGQKELFEKSLSYLSDLGNPTNIATVLAHVGDGDENLFDAESVDLCLSRNFLMHLYLEGYERHMNQVHSILKRGGYYIFSVLNPAYESAKASTTLKNGERYEFAHGKNGEYGIFYHYFKTLERYESTMSKFDVVKIIPCTPITEQFKSTHERYYDPTTPMAFVYVLKK